MIVLKITSDQVLKLEIQTDLRCVALGMGLG